MKWRLRDSAQPRVITAERIIIYLALRSWLPGGFRGSEQGRGRVLCPQSASGLVKSAVHASLTAVIEFLFVSDRLLD